MMMMQMIYGAQRTTLRMIVWAMSDSHAPSLFSDTYLIVFLSPCFRLLLLLKILSTIYDFLLLLFSSFGWLLSFFFLFCVFLKKKKENNRPLVSVSLYGQQTQRQRRASYIYLFISPAWAIVSRFMISAAVNYHQDIVVHKKRWNYKAEGVRRWACVRVYWLLSPVPVSVGGGDRFFFSGRVTHATHKPLRVIKHSAISFFFFAPFPFQIFFFYYVPVLFFLPVITDFGNHHLRLVSFLLPFFLCYYYYQFFCLSVRI